MPMVVGVLFAILVGQVVTAETFSWRPHVIRQGDGKGGWITRNAQLQFLAGRIEGKVEPLAFGGGAGTTMGFGLAQMDNGEVVFLGTWQGKGSGPQTVVAISQNRGALWTELQPIPGISSRPMNLTNLGGETLSFVADRRHYSHDNGRTWTDHVPHPKTEEGMPFNLEGNAWVDRDKDGKAKAVYEIGWHYKPGEKHPRDDAWAVFRRSADGGRTWTDEVSPPQWKMHITHNGKKYVRGISEGAIVRAANGDLVAALRTDMHPRYLDEPNADHYEGTGISISKDDGETWSPINLVFEAGRMHANLLRMSNDDLVMTVTVRLDIADEKMASYRRGCEAVISRDHGVTWEVDRKYILDESEFFDHAYPHLGSCGHLYSIVLDDGSILTTHNNYLTKLATLIRWEP